MSKLETASKLVNVLQVSQLSLKNLAKVLQNNKQITNNNFSVKINKVYIICNMKLIEDQCNHNK